MTKRAVSGSCGTGAGAGIRTTVSSITGIPYVADVINKHTTIANHHITLNMPDLSENLFNLRYLSEKAH